MNTAAASTNPTSNKVLVVDDEAALRFPICEFLREAGVIVLEASDADEAISLLRADELISVVFSDIRMPGSMDGVELANSIKLNFTHVDVILTSGNIPMNIDPKTKVIPKPYSLTIVSERILAALLR